MAWNEAIRLNAGVLLAAIALQTGIASASIDIPFRLAAADMIAACAEEIESGAETIVSAEELVERLGVSRGANVKASPVPLRTITFKLGSAELTPIGKKQLNELARAMNYEGWKANHFLVNGHTDSTGSEAFNQTLSEMRAAAVVAYLGNLVGEGQTPVDPARLVAKGFGETQLVNAKNGAAGENRRIEIIFAE